jgi:enamine deaminase RidA (YjgF/YER057c/UK114 family)
MADKTVPDSAAGLHVVGLPRKGLTEMFVAASALSGEPPDGMFRRLRACLRERPGAKVLKESIFGAAHEMGKAPRAKGRAGTGRSGWPVTRVAEGAANGKRVAGVHVHAVQGVEVSPIRMGGRVVGTVFQDAYARYCVLGDIRPDDARLPAEEQARLTFEILEAALLLAEMDFSHVVRTWLFLDKILTWYDQFNLVRTRFFSERGVYDRVVPASTGIGMGNSAGTALVAEAIAIRPKDRRVRIESVPSPLQCPALKYGSSFSRAVEVAMPDHRRLMVSGTASIDLQGQTAHLGDMDAQTDLTMRVVEAILRAREMDWSDVCRAVAYVKHARHAPALARYCAARRLPALPVVTTKADVCREGLLFEIEVDAVRGR